ncbi:hypothetical protein NN561_019181 [Cricetulus griseus]
MSDPGSNSERSTDSPVAGSEDDLVAAAPLHSPEWSEERFRVDRKKLEAMLQGVPATPAASFPSPRQYPLPPARACLLWSPGKALQMSRLQLEAPAPTLKSRAGASHPGVGIRVLAVRG